MTTPRAFFEEQVPAKLAGNPGLAERSRGVYQFNVTGEGGGCWTVDLTQGAGTVREGPADQPGCSVTVAAPDLAALIDKTLNAQLAFMTGKLKIQGDMGLAMKLANLL